jgi:hypothetical protein
MAFTDRQTLAARAAIRRAVVTFMRSIDRLETRRGPIASDLIEEWVLLELFEALNKRLQGRAVRLSDAMLKLSNALADCRNSRSENRG